MLGDDANTTPDAGDDDAGVVNTSRRASYTRAFLWVEMLALFVGGPILYWRLVPGPGWLFPALWAWAAVCLGLLLMDGRFERRRLGWRNASSTEASRVLRLFAALGLSLLAVVALWDWLVQDRSILFSLVRRDPWLWSAIMVGYPVASVYAQELIFRAFFFHRYRPLLPSRWAMIAASALAFAWVHIIFQNWLAVAMTLPGGLIFAWRYDRTGSTLLVSFEHALYGCLIFTIGIGQYFYSGRIQ